MKKRIDCHGGGHGGGSGRVGQIRTSHRKFCSGSLSVQMGSLKV